MSEGSKLYLRNVHPNFFDNGRVGSGSFAPSEAHDYKLSVDDSALSSATESLRRHTVELGFSSAAVFGVEDGEFSAHDVDCLVDPLPDNPAHALADYAEVKAVSKGNVRKVARKIAALANRRGKLA